MQNHVDGVSLTPRLCQLRCNELVVLVGQFNSARQTHRSSPPLNSHCGCQLDAKDSTHSNLQNAIPDTYMNSIAVWFDKNVPQKAGAMWFKFALGWAVIPSPKMSAMLRRFI